MIDGAVVSRVSSFFSVGLSVAFRIIMADQETTRRLRRLVVSRFFVIFVNMSRPGSHNMGDRAVQIHENAQKARNDQAPKAPGRFSLFRHFREYDPPGLPYGWTRLVGNQKKREKTKFIL